MKDFFTSIISKINRQGFFYTVMCLVGGLLLTVWSDYATVCIVSLLLAILVVYGIFNILRYFLSDMEIGAQSLLFFRGVVAIEITVLAALTYFCGMSVFLALYIGAVGVISAMRFQCTVDMARRKVRIWYVFLIISIVLLLLAALPFAFTLSTATLYRVVGIALLVECPDDFFCRLIIKTMDE